MNVSPPVATRRHPGLGPRPQPDCLTLSNCVLDRMIDDHHAGTHTRLIEDRTRPATPERSPSQPDARAALQCARRESFRPPTGWLSRCTTRDTGARWPARESWSAGSTAAAAVRVCSRSPARDATDASNRRERQSGRPRSVILEQPAAEHVIATLRAGAAAVFCANGGIGLVARVAARRHRMRYGCAVSVKRRS